MPTPHAKRPGRTWPLFVGVLAALGIVAGLELYGVLHRQDRPLPAPAATATPAPAASPPAAPAAAPATRGSLDVPAQDALAGPHVHLEGWAVAAQGLRAVEVRAGGRAYPAQFGLARPDVAKARPDLAGAGSSGFAFEGTLPAPSADRSVLTVVAIDRDGRETVLGTRDMVDADALARWRTVEPSAVAAHGTPAFWVLPALSGIKLGGALELDTWYRAYQSSTVRTGMRVPILYLRTTRGHDADYVFDPDWDIERRCGARRIAEDALGPTLAYATEHAIPVLLTLNGGIWADASCDVPDWDVNDHLEQDVANCQWNEKNEVMPDDYLRHLPGSQDAPELARSLTFNVYAREVRHYKRRNLQAAARQVMAFARAHPELFVGITLDPDTYMNPFFDQAQWYDYNPGTLRQFREWLAGTGPYAGHPAPGVPSLAAYRRARPLSLADVSRLAGRRFARWEDVDPPRTFPRESKDGRAAFWEDPWTHEWEVFRRHLVHLHYDELSQWLTEAGVPRDRIWSSQGFMAPHPSALPFALHVTSPSKNYDTGGMSVEGAIPRNGHLGAILYGPSAVNDIRMEEPHSLFATFRAMDPGWAVVELNTADLRNPAAQPAYAAAYRSLRDLWNYGAHYVSPMAWNGSNGVNAGKPGYVTFTAWRNTPLEDAARDFMVSHAGLPAGTRLWTFGASRHADDDGWTAEHGTVALAPGRFEVRSDRGGITLVSPRDLAVVPRDFAALVLGLPEETAVERVRIEARTAPDAPWKALADVPSARLQRSAAGLVAPLPRNAPAIAADQMRIVLTLRTFPGSSAAFARIALWPARAPALVTTSR